MGIGIGILLLVIGLIILFAINEFPASLQEVVEPTPACDLRHREPAAAHRQDRPASFHASGP